MSWLHELLHVSSIISQVAGHPRNNLMTDNTFLTVERLADDEVWIPIATDADWETKYVLYSITKITLLNV